MLLQRRRELPPAAPAIAVQTSLPLSPPLVRLDEGRAREKMWEAGLMRRVVDEDTGSGE